MAGLAPVLLSGGRREPVHGGLEVASMPLTPPATSTGPRPPLHGILGFVTGRVAAATLSRFHALRLTRNLLLRIAADGHPVPAFSA